MSEEPPNITQWISCVLEFVLLESLSFYLREEPFQFYKVWSPFTTYLGPDCLRMMTAGLCGLSCSRFDSRFYYFSFIFNALFRWTVNPSMLKLKKRRQYKYQFLSQQNNESKQRSTDMLTTRHLTEILPCVPCNQLTKQKAGLAQKINWVQHFSESMNIFLSLRGVSWE